MWTFETFMNIVTGIERSRFKIKISKCNFLKPNIVGHLISGQGMLPLPENRKCQSNVIIQKPSRNKAISWTNRVLWKVCSQFSDIAKPLTNLTRMDFTFKWTKQCHKAFNLLKQNLLIKPVLKYPDQEKPYIIFTDVSKCFWTCTLTQTHNDVIDDKSKIMLHPIPYISGYFKVVN